jgi:ABC-2 type transport system ATP-binding protein
MVLRSGGRFGWRLKGYDAAAAPGGARAPAVPDESLPAVEGAIVEAIHLTKQLDGRLAVDDVSFAVREGELFALIGPSGSGKTTIVRMICGIYAADSGAVRLWGRRHVPWPRAFKNRFGYMPQSYSLYPRMTAAENLRYAAALHGVGRAATARRLAEVLELVDLTDQRARLAGEMSGGQRRRLALALSLMHDPELLFVDEPTAGLDPALRARLWTYFRQLTRAGRTVIVTTQYIDEAELTDRVAIMRTARLAALGTPLELAREAFGGEIVELHSPDLTAQAARALSRLEGVHDVAFADLETLQVVVDVAEEAAPRLLAALARWGCTVRAVGLRRPRFEDVFLRLTGVAPQPESSDLDTPGADAEAVIAHVPHAATGDAARSAGGVNGKDEADGPGEA